MTYTTIITSKGQVTVPIAIRQYLGIKPGDKINFSQVDNHIIIKPSPSTKDLKGSLKSTKKFSNSEAYQSVLNYKASQYAQNNRT